MASINVNFTLNRGELNRIISPIGPVGRATSHAADKVVKDAKASVTSYGRVRTGRMRRMIRKTPVVTTGTLTSSSVEAAADYSIYQIRGTRYISAAPFLTDALNRLSVGDFRP